MNELHEAQVAARQKLEDKLNGTEPLKIAFPDIAWGADGKAKSRVVSFTKEVNFKLDRKTKKVEVTTQVTTLDWLRVTTNDIEAFYGTMDDLTGEDGLLTHADIDVQWQKKGLLGYEESATLLIWRDNDYATVGHIGLSKTGRNKGGLFELTGLGCKVLSLENPALWQELYSILQHHEWRVTRADIALDLMGDYAIANNYTVPRLKRQAANDELFLSDNQRNPDMKQSFSSGGDWTDFEVGNLTVDDYDPLEYCKAGLTAYIGSRCSDDFFRVYEKGKQLLGAMAEPESIDRGWVRIEHEMKRRSSGRVIPLDVMIRPDEYFCAGRSGVRAIMNKVREAMKLESAEAWQRETFQKEKDLTLSRKIHWCRYSYGRLVRTLRDKGVSAEDIVDQLTRIEGLKEFVFDIASDGTPELQKTGLQQAVAA